MSGLMNKIADAVTGHHGTHGTTSTSTTPSMTSTSSTGTNYSGSGSNYGGSAQVRDTGLAHQKDHHLGRDAAAGAAGGAIGGVPGAALGAGTSHLSHQHGTHSGLTSSHSGSYPTTTSTSTSTDRSHDDAMTRSEEQLRVGKEKVNLGKVELNKYVTTEKVSQAVPVMQEKAILEREPITEANRRAAMSGPDFKEAHYEVNLMAEKAVAQKEEVPIERVRLRKEAEQTQQYVEADLRKEHIEAVDGSKTLERGAGMGTGMGLGAAGLGSRQSNLGHQAAGSSLGSETRASGLDRDRRL